MARHRYIFSSRTLEHRLTKPYDYLTCWLRSVTEARTQVGLHVESQQAAAARFFGPPPPLTSPSDDLDSQDDDYIASTALDTASTSLVTTSTHPSTCTYLTEADTLPDDGSWGSPHDIFSDYTSSDDISLTGPFNLGRSEPDGVLLVHFPASFSSNDDKSSLFGSLAAAPFVNDGNHSDLSV
jgi:hypothetical protein